jgi:hypothetical protein
MPQHRGRAVGQRTEAFLQPGVGGFASAGVIPVRHSPPFNGLGESCTKVGAAAMR